MEKGGGPVDEELVGLFDLSHDAFCIAGLDGYLKRANPAFARSLGYSLDELLARPFMDNVYPDDVESVRTVLAAFAAGDDIVGFECRQVCADGSVRWFEWSTSSRPEAGTVYGVARDVTERREANDELSALRRIATLAAEGAAPSDLFAVVAEEAAPRRQRLAPDRCALRGRRHGNGMRQRSATGFGLSRRQAVVIARHERAGAGADEFRAGPH
jgi:PAS domain S-box-containing protein